MLLLKEKIHVSWLVNLIGVYLLLIPTRPLFYLGNLIVYVPSYIFHKTGKISDHSKSAVQESWFTAVFITSWMVGLAVSGWAARLIKVRLVIGIGIFCHTLAFPISVFTINVSTSVFSFALCLCVGFGIGLYEGLLLKHYVIENCPGSTNSVISIVLSSGPLGGVLINMAITMHTNSDNLSPDVTIGKIKIFTQQEIIERIPSLFHVLAGGSLLISTVGFLMLNKHTEPSKESKISENIRLKSTACANGTSLSSNLNEFSHNSFQNDDKHESIVDTRETNRDVPIIETGNDIQTVLNKQPSYKPSDLIKSSLFYKLEFLYMVVSWSRVIVSAYYKIYGEVWIHDDHFLTILGISISVFSVFSSIILGFVLDRTGLKWFFIMMYSTISVGCLVMYFMARVDKWAYLVATLVASICPYYSFCIFALAVNTLFGKDHLERNMALAEVGASLGFISSTFVIDEILIRFGYFAAFLLTSGLHGIALLVIVLFFPRN